MDGRRAESSAALRWTKWMDWTRPHPGFPGYKDTCRPGATGEVPDFFWRTLSPPGFTRPALASREGIPPTRPVFCQVPVPGRRDGGRHRRTVQQGCSHPWKDACRGNPTVSITPE